MSEEMKLEELEEVSGGATKYFLRHTILKGETLYSLAKKYNTTVNELIRINKIKDKDLIIAGHKILIPKN